MDALCLGRERLSLAKHETLENLKALHLLHPMTGELSRQILKDDILEKLNQHVFNHLTYYLVCIISVKNSLPWPLYDSVTERAYKKELANFIAPYQKSGQIAPVMSSYFVRPTSPKITKLLYQLSQLAIKSALQHQMKREKHKLLYKNMSDMYNAKKDVDTKTFVENVEKTVHNLYGQLHEHQYYKQNMEVIAEKLRNQIIENEKEIKEKFDFIDMLCSGFSSTNKDELSIIECIKNVEHPVSMFEDMLTRTDNKIEVLQNTWKLKTNPCLETSKQCFEVYSSLIARHTGEADRKSYIVEYNSDKDGVCTKNLEAICSSQQRYILKNITRDQRLIFPNLIRGFIVAICYILKNTEIGDDIYKVTEYLESCRSNVCESLTAMKVLLSSLITADAKLQPSCVDISLDSLSDREYQEIMFVIPPLPDLTIGNDPRSQAAFDGYTPLNITRRQFNIRKRNSLTDIVKLQPKSLMMPMHSQRDDFLRNMISCHINSHDRTSIQNISVFSQPPSRINETVADCSSGFTKQQIMRLLSTKKSTAKKSKLKPREQINTKTRSSLFSVTNESSVLFRSHSSPNLNENREKKSFSKLYKGAQLAIMPENSPSSILEVSGIVALEANSKNSTLSNSNQLDDPQNVFNVKTLPTINIISPVESELLKFKKFNIEAINLELSAEKPVLSQRNSIEAEKNMTPKFVTNPLRKSSSVEKIINRYKRIRAKTTSTKITEEIEKDDFLMVVENKENEFGVDTFTPNKNSLPDLLSPSCNLLNKLVNDNEWPIFNSPDETEIRPRESLGTLLGVDNTFLDQFDLVD